MKINLYVKYCILLLLVSCLGCQPGKSYVIKVKLVKITVDNMFERDVISDYLFDAEELNVDSLRNKSRQLFLAGVDLYKNKKKPANAVALFEQSILVFPDAKTYYELGSALLDANSNIVPQTRDEHKGGLEEAKRSLEVAENLQFQPKSMIYYDEACIDYLLNGVDSDEDGESNRAYHGWPLCIEDLHDAFQAGFSDTVMFERDYRINPVTRTRSYKSMLLSLRTSQASAKPQSLFETYKSAFPPISQPFEIGVDKVDMKDYTQSISYDFADFIPEMGNTEFGRGVSNDYFYVGKVAETPLYCALIYSSTSYRGEKMEPVFTKLVTYTPTGKIIDTRVFSCQASPEEIKTGKIDKNEITLEDLKRTWKYPIDKVAFDTNKIMKYESQDKATFMINDSGRIVAKSVPANYHDSAVTVSNTFTNNKHL